MSQRAVFIQLSDENYATYHYGETCAPDRETIESLARDYDLQGDIAAEYEWYEIGEGESDTDSFFTNDTLADMYETGDFVKACEEKGYDADLIEYGTINGYVEEDE